MKNDKYCQILEGALKVFARFGLRKTSIDDIAKASDISRQGVYLYFKSKEEIFKAAVEKYLAERNEAAEACLRKSGSPLAEKLFCGLDEWFGPNIGMLHQDATDVIEEGRLIMGTIYADYMVSFKKLMQKTISHDCGADERHATDVSEILYACGLSWKHEVSTREEFGKRMKSAIKICLGGRT